MVKTPSMPGKIFINYRRGDDPGFAQALLGRLEQAFPSEQLFMDVDNIEPGLDFVRVLEEQVAQCDVLITVIGKNWSEARDEHGGRRLDNPEDFVRIEIESALTQEKRVIPVLVGQASMPHADELPDPMKPLARRQAVRLTHDRFRADTESLIVALKRALANVDEARAKRQAEQERQEAEAAEAAQRAEAEKARQADEERQKREAEQARIAALEAEAQEKAQEEAETKRRAEEEKARQADEERQKREAAAEQARIAALETKAQEEADAKRRIEAEKARQADEERKKREAAAEQARIAALEAKAQEKAQEEAEIKRRTETEKARQADEERQRREAEAERARIAALEAKARDEAEANRRAEVEKDQQKSEEDPQGHDGKQRRRLLPLLVAASLLVVVVLGAVAAWFVLSPTLKPLTAAQEQTLKVKDTFQECSNCPVMTVVPAGSFFMGSPTNEPGRDNDEGPQHVVNIASQFAVGKYEVTFGQWNACVADGGCSGYKPSDEGWSGDRQPVVNVSWNDANAYVTWLAKKTGKPYRLLSEAEYEYAARGGATTAYPWGDSIGKNNANCDGCGSQWGNKQTAPVGSFAANGFGLYDMVGNVWEWTQDCYHSSYDDAPTDGSAWSKGNCRSRVLRGGSWDTYPRFIRSADRDGLTPDLRNNDFGFRVARTLATTP
jgi:formylglycine-generating enzyme required for sulfatase activity